MRVTQPSFSSSCSALRAVVLLTRCRSIMSFSEGTGAPGVNTPRWIWEMMSRLIWKYFGGAYLSVFTDFCRAACSDNLKRALGQRLDESLAVAFGEYAVVQRDDDAGVGFRADKP